MRLLDRNIEQNDISNTVVHAVALGSHQGTAQLYRYKASNKGRHSLAIAHGPRSRTVPLTTLDASLSALGFAEALILLMKIDVEGYEPEVLAGAQQSLTRVAAAITEYDPVSSLDGNLAPQRAIDLMIAAGLKAHVLGDGVRPAPADLEKIRAAGQQIELIWLRP